MSVQDVDQQPADAAPDRRRTDRNRSDGVARAYERRTRRQARVSGHRLTSTGAPVHRALRRAPFLVGIMLLLAGGLTTVLLLSTLTDQANIQQSRSRSTQQSLQLSVEAARQSVAALGAIDRIAREAQSLGMVPAGDAAVLMVGTTGAATVVGTPTAVPTPTTAPATTAPATTAPATTAPATTAPATTAPAAPKTTPVAPKTTPAAPKTTPAAPKTTPAAPKTTPTAPAGNAARTTGTTTARSGR
jgi:hypothetical protein